MSTGCRRFRGAPKLSRRREEKKSRSVYQLTYTIHSETSMSGLCLYTACRIRSFWSYYQIYSVLLPICTVAMVVKLFCMYHTLYYWNTYSSLRSHYTMWF
jgi:FtsH-binding integral membrane protein